MTTTRYVPSVLVAGDTLASLAGLYKIDPVDLAAANGVAPSAGRARDCAWGRRVDAWVLGRSTDVPTAPAGRRAPYDPSAPWVCAPGEGFAMFVDGQVIRLPAGGPRRPATLPAPSRPAPTTKKGRSRAGLVVAVVGTITAIGVGVAAARRKDRP